ncbi:bilirubin oxidase [Pseudomonas taeanensis MS-3]|uniref:Multicopper oxidase CueO n=1 Tax=Pseudomonas taeanensis MS-3 TaxID=1395571 RepID=A0A0A1YFS2_9PSED|nr:multicopper oxidase domain-containing protein [Pseudomonas taeanensis]KFX68792.1 bilirubin oxidase [Pseudomonas taeanensis MS-3]
MNNNGKKNPSAAPNDPPDGPARRTFLKLSATALTAPLLLSARNSDAAEWVTTPQPVFPPSPPTRPWLEELPRQIVPIESVSTLDPPPSVSPNTAGGEAGRAPHQRYAELTGVLGTPEFYELSVVENAEYLVHPDLPTQRVWAYRGTNPDATVPATIFAHYGSPTLCRIYNKLPENHVGFGSPEISTHLHNLHTPSESDGYPGDFYSKSMAGPTLDTSGTKQGAGEFKDHFYPNIYAGYDEWRALYGDGIGDPKEAQGTLWYHDHTEDFTATNVYRGLVGFYLLFDHIDTGKEDDDKPGALRLPSHPYDYPLAFGDRRFAPLPDGQLFYDDLHVEGVLGDKIVVNGKIEPVLRVDARKYRLRLLNSGPSRFYEFYLVTAKDKVQRFTYIANDGNLLPQPLFNQSKVRLAVAERADIVVDFSQYPIGTELYLVNRLRQDSTRKPKDVKAPGTRVLKFIVDRNPPEQDLSQVPNQLRPLPDLPTPEEIDKLPKRRWEFDRKNGLWTINGRLFDTHNPRAKIKQGSAEVWELVGKSGGWSHPIHIHLEEGRILSKSVDGIEVPVPLHERGRKDVFVLEQTMTMRVLMRFRDFHGKYVMHCHNVIHEDHAMMVRFDIEGEDD